jgi:SAM-dependent methyltransferase
MHASALESASEFFGTYPLETATVVDIGSQNVNGSLRDVCPKHYTYIGLDYSPANGVDIVLEDEYKFPLETTSADIVVTSSCFEHAEMFWLTFLEGMRILKPGGLFYINAPSKGEYHAFPQDCWRFYPDAAKALQKWSARNNMPCEILYTKTLEGNWGDFIVVYRKT